jgi:hypothetical protein
VRQGRLGVKSGHGFWKWTAEEATRIREEYEQTLVAALGFLTERESN